MLLLGFLTGLAALSNVVSADDQLGRWGQVFNMEVIPIHVMLLPDGHVLSYGADAEGKQGGGRFYEVWDTTTGQHEVAANHVLLTQSADVNIFCSTLSIDITTGNILIMGGDDEDNLGINDVLEFVSETHEIRRHVTGDMVYPRWYGTSVNMPDGRIFIAGGKSAVVQVGSSVPEIWYPGSGFQALLGADIPSMQFVGRKTWWYPHVYVNSMGDIIMVIGDKRGRDVYRLTVDGNGSIEVVGTRPFLTHKLGASIMYDVDKVVFLDEEGKLWCLDISDSSNPIFTEKADVGEARTNGAMSLLPDGRVLIAGGSSDSGDDNGNRIEVAVYIVQIWDPVSNTVYTGPRQEIPRLYHSSGLILPDGSVFSAGGGSPGPLKNHNGQIYYPGYMFDSTTGEAASRPIIQSCPSNIKAGSAFRIVVDDSSAIVQLTATKPGAMTHSRNCDARWLNLAFTVLDQTTIEVLTPGETIMIPGLWYLNVIDEDGVPSVASIFGVNMAGALGGPTEAPTVMASAVPSTTPSVMTSAMPSLRPSTMPSGEPSVHPGGAPSSVSANVDAATGGDVTSAAVGQSFVTLVCAAGVGLLSLL